jgi:dynein heavy chain
MGHQPSVILVGEAGCGKSSIWRSLVASHNYGRAQSRTVVEPLNPKVLTVNELYGHLSRELVWSDGSLTAIMRSMSRSLPPYHNHDSKWIVLDGDMDGSWTDMLLTVMNQDGALTLGQDSISLSPSMRLLFEVHSLQNASPASVSRAGIHCVVEGEKGWFLPCQSWMQIHSENTYLPLLTHLFQRHIPSLMRMAEQVKLKSLEPVGLSPTGSICGLLDLLSVLLSRSEFGNSLALSHHTDLKDEKVERIFLWAALWAFGGAFDRPGRQVFSDLWRTSMPHQPLELPDDGLIFDYRLEPSGCLVPWIDHLCIGNALGGSPADGGSFISVPTTQSAQLLYMMTAINEGGKHLMAVGRAGGKTSIAQDFIRNGRGVDYSTRICVSYFSTAATLQARLEYSLEKCGGKIYAPPMGRRHIYFIDDLNMSNPDEYGTQSPVELLRQWMDYGSW